MTHTTSTRRTAEHTALRIASRIAREGNALAKLERDKPGHGAAELARRVKAAEPAVSLAAARRAADAVLAVRLGRPTHLGLTGNGRTVERRAVPSRALGRTPAVTAPLADRLVAYKVARVRAAFEGTGFRHSRAWEGAADIRVEFGAPGASQSTTEGWIDYKSRGYKRGIVGESVRVSVPADWGTRVRPLDDTAGLLLLDAERLPTWGQVEVYRAVWARQGRGVSLVVERGHLARHTPTGISFHSTDADPERALRGLKRQVTAAGVAPEVRDAARRERARLRAERQASQLARLIEKVRRYDLSEVELVAVTRQDSLRAGNCIPGTDAFIDRFGFDGRESATIGEIARAVGLRGIEELSGADLTLARQLAAACLVAIRRDRAARRVLA